MSRAYGRIFLAAIFLSLLANKAYAASGNKTKKLTELTAGQVVKIGGVSFVKTANNQLIATSLCPEGSSYSSLYKGCVVTTTNFAYTGGIQTFSASADTNYVLEVWGGAGGYGRSTTYRGGYGGYAIGLYRSATAATLYVVVGGQGGNAVKDQTNYAGGYNGGAN